MRGYWKPCSELVLLKTKGKSKRLYLALSSRSVCHSAHKHAVYLVSGWHNTHLCFWEEHFVFHFEIWQGIHYGWQGEGWRSLSRRRGAETPGSHSHFLGTWWGCLCLVRHWTEFTVTQTQDTVLILTSGFSKFQSCDLKPGSLGWGQRSVVKLLPGICQAPGSLATHSPNPHTTEDDFEIWFIPRMSGSVSYLLPLMHYLALHTTEFNWGFDIIWRRYSYYLEPALS